VDSRPSSRLGAGATIALGISYLAVGVGYLLQPEAQRSGTADQNLLSLADNATGFRVVNWSLALGGIVALAAVPAICSAIRANRDWTAWARNLGVVGFAVATVNAFRTLALGVIEAGHFAYSVDPANADEIAIINQVAILNDNMRLSLDTDGWMSFGVVGLFVLLTSVLGTRSGFLPKALGAIGILTSVLYALVVVGFTSGNSDLVAIAAAAGGIVLAPVFFIWTGLRLGAEQDGLAGGA